MSSVSALTRQLSTLFHSIAPMNAWATFVSRNAQPDSAAGARTLRLSRSNSASVSGSSNAPPRAPTAATCFDPPASPSSRSSALSSSFLKNAAAFEPYGTSVRMH